MVIYAVCFFVAKVGLHVFGFLFRCDTDRLSLYEHKFYTQSTLKDTNTIVYFCLHCSVETEWKFTELRRTIGGLSRRSVGNRL